jgi:WD40 repeat protein
LVTGSMDGTVRTWDMGPGREGLTIQSGGARVVYSPDGRRLATDGFDRIARVWDAQTGDAVADLVGHSGGQWSLAWSPDSARLATASSDGSARVWNLAATQQAELILVGHGGVEDDPELATVRDIAYSRDAALIATAGWDGTARVWDAQSGRELHKLMGHMGLVVGVAFSPDGNRLATTGTDGNVIVWDTTTGALVLSWHSHEGANPDVAFSPDGTRLLTGANDALARVFDAATGELLFTLAGHRANIWSVAFSPDGHRVATGSADGTARVWDAETGTLLTSLPGSRGDVMGVSFSPHDGGAQLAVASSDGIVRVYLLEIDDLLALAHARLTRGLTLGECQTFLHQTQCP